MHLNPGPTTNYPCPWCSRNVTSWGVSYTSNRCYGWVHTKCSGLLNAAQYRRKVIVPATLHGHTDDPAIAATNTLTTYKPCSIYRTSQWCQHVIVPRLNANGIGNKLTELGIVLERITLASEGVWSSRLWSTSQLFRPSGQQCFQSGGVRPQNQGWKVIHIWEQLQRICVLCVCECYKGGIVVIDVIWRRLCVNMIWERVICLFWVGQWWDEWGGEYLFKT